jgi:hypothetical protein
MVAALVLAGLSVLCAAGAMSQESVRLEAPPGWTTAPASEDRNFHVVVIWTSKTAFPAGFYENVNVQKLPYSGNLHDYVTETMALTKSQVFAANIVRRPNRRCPNGTSEFLSMTMIPTKKKLLLEDVFTQQGDFVYLATYTRAVGSPANPAAEKAIEEMCPHS